MSDLENGVRNFRICVMQGMSGHFAAMVADYEDMGWSHDVVSTGIGRYKAREGAEKEGRSWAKSEEIPFVS